jgi:hypothetical protein
MVGVVGGGHIAGVDLFLLSTTAAVQLQWFWLFFGLKNYILKTMMIFCDVTTVSTKENTFKW